jgi:phenylacetate-CoA ligase
MTEIGSLAIECAQNPGGLHLLETECIVEILDPESQQEVSPGQLGELVITNLGRLGSPLIRYRTGDLVVADTSECPCGRALLRLAGGILGRTDDMITVRGNNVFPSSIEAVLREIDNLAEYRVLVETQRSMQHLRIEVEPSPDADVDQLVDTVARAVKDRLNFQADVVAVPPESLPRFELKGRRFLKKDA